MKIPTNVLVFFYANTVADLEGVQGVRSNPPLEPNYFVFIGNFKKFGVKLGK